MKREEISGAVLDRYHWQWAEDGYVQISGFLSDAACRALIEAGQALLGDSELGVVVRAEDNLPADLPLETRVSKLYRLHHVAPFQTLSTSPALMAYVAPLIPGDIDVFSSQLVWKVPGSLGQPWHQDASVFPFEPPGPIVGTWIALTHADADTSCLRVVPGSHHSGLVDHVFDKADRTRGRYFRVHDQTIDGYETLSAQPGDLMVFDSRLLHMSTDNTAEQARAALTLHYARAGTIDRTAETFGQSPYNHWLPAHRVKAA